MSGDLVLVGAGEPKRVAEIAERIEGATELAIDDHAARFRVPDGASGCRACCASWTPRASR